MSGNVANEPLDTSDPSLRSGRTVTGERGGARPRLKAQRQLHAKPHREAIKYLLVGSPLIGPEKRKKKAIRTKNCLSEASFFRSAFF